MENHSEARQLPAGSVMNPIWVPELEQEAVASQRGHKVRLILAFASIYLLWGSTYLAIRYAVTTIPPLATAGIRDAIAGIILLAVAWIRGFRPRREHWLGGLVAGALFFVVGHSGLNWAEQYVSSGASALLITTEPMFILVLGWLLGSQRITWLSALGLGLGVVGVGLLTGAQFRMTGHNLLGFAAVLLSAFGWAAGVVVSPKLRLPSDALARTAIPLVCGGALLLIAAGTTGEFQRMRWSAISLGSLLGLGYLIVFGSVVAFTAYTWLLQQCPPALVATHTYANPVVAVLLGWLLASEPLTMKVVFALVAVLGAIVLIRRGESAVAASNAELIGVSAELNSTYPRVSVSRISR
jgi:drug/metabolite transporter (DMT)-like permease